MTNLKYLKLNIKNIDIPANISSIATRFGRLKGLELFTDLINILISFHTNLMITCRSETDDYINDIPSLIIEYVKIFSISECLLPHNNSIAIFKNKFNIKNLISLVIGSGEVNKQRTLSSEHFAGFEDLNSLLVDINVMNATEDAFKYFHNLEFLEITGNTILHTPKSLSFFKKLRFFHIHNSKLTTIPKSFLSSKYIKDFAIINNEVALETIDADLFLQQTDVTFVTIKNNSLKIIHEDIFKTSLGLTFVDLSLNRIEVLPKNIFRNQILLGMLDLSGNFIFELHTDVFSSIDTLSILRLSNNKISKIPE